MDLPAFFNDSSITESNYICDRHFVQVKRLRKSRGDILCAIVGCTTPRNSTTANWQICPDILGPNMTRFTSGQRHLYICEAHMQEVRDARRAVEEESDVEEESTSMSEASEVNTAEDGASDASAEEISSSDDGGVPIEDTDTASDCVMSVAHILEWAPYSLSCVKCGNRGASIISHKHIGHVLQVHFACTLSACEHKQFWRSSNTVSSTKILSSNMRTVVSAFTGI